MDNDETKHGHLRMLQAGAELAQQQVASDDSVDKMGTDATAAGETLAGPARIASTQSIR